MKTTIRLKKELIATANTDVITTITDTEVRSSSVATLQKFDLTNLNR